MMARACSNYMIKEILDKVEILTRVVEEREWKNGKLIEVSRNFFAICDRTKDVFYLVKKLICIKAER